MLYTMIIKEQKGKIYIMKRLLTLIAILVLLVGMVSACSGSDDDENEGNTTNPPSTESPGSGNEPSTPPVNEEPAQNEELSENYTYTMTASVSDGTEMAMDVWCKGDKYRMDIQTNALGTEPMKISWIIKDGFVYTYMPSLNMAIKYASEEVAGFDESFEQMFTGYYTTHTTDNEILEDLKASCTTSAECKSVEIIGNETIDGEACIIFGIELNDGSTEKIWIAKGKGYMLKAEVTAGEVTTIVEFSGVNPNAQIADSVFDLPEGVQVTDMS